ncbi:MAG: type I restriction-modification system subunit M [Lactobacillales bacterium]|jgi:type I restriction enzyme M protein|nr:type I restriction-modification system subunit M [Lactobacillales bacterium]
MENNHTKQTNANVQEKSNLIWNIANLLRGAYKPYEYGKVILPMTVIKRLHDTLLPTHEAVIKAAEQHKDKATELAAMFIKEATKTPENPNGYDFFNTSPFTFDKLLADADQIETNFRAYLNGFSENVQEILENFEFENQISKLADNNSLFLIITEFNSAKAKLGADEMTSTDMGYVFEELVRRFSESTNEGAGEHFTSRDIIYLMTDLLLVNDKDILTKQNITKTVYDQTMGTSQMLSAMQERIHELNKSVDVVTYGQEFNPETFAIAKSDTMIRGGNPDNMKKGNTLSEDQFPGYTFDYCISNPPFGIDWKTAKDAVEAEHALGENGRFAPGTPKISDGQLLFQLNGLSKLKDHGRMAIVHNGSALFSGNAGGGESEIRRYVIENDYLEAIVQLPTDLFYNTGISTYVWIFSKNKSAERAGKIQLIDASQMYVKRRKNIGSKRVEIDTANRDAIVQAYGDFQEKNYEVAGNVLESKIFDNEDFGFSKIVVQTPLKDEAGEIILKKGKPTADKDAKDTEDIPLKENIEDYFEREVLPYNPGAWIDEKGTKIGYEIPFTRLFYKYVAPEASETIASRIKELEASIMKSFDALANGEVK